MIDEKRKIAIYISSLDSGGAQRAVSNLSLSLNLDYYQIYIILNENKIKYNFHGEIICLNVPQKSKNSLFKIYHFTKKILKIRKIKKRYQFDVVVSFLPSQNIINILTKFNEFNVISVRNHMTERLKINNSRLMNLLMKFLYKSADRVVAVSQGIKEDLVNNYKISHEKIKVINNLLKESIQSRPIESSNEKILLKLRDKKILVNVGSLGNQKGQWHLLRIFKELTLKMNNIHLIIIGDGPLKNLYIDFIEKNQLRKCVTIIEYTRNPFYVLSKSYAYIHTSIYEGFPNAIIEAASQGLPIVTSYFLSGIEDLLDNANSDHSNEILLTHKLSKKIDLSNQPLDISESEMFTKLTILLKDEKLKEEYSLKALKIADKFHHDKILPLWDEIFNNY